MTGTWEIKPFGFFAHLLTCSPNRVESPTRFGFGHFPHELHQASYIFRLSVENTALGSIWRILVFQLSYEPPLGLYVPSFNFSRVSLPFFADLLSPLDSAPHNHVKTFGRPPSESEQLLDCEPPRFRVPRVLMGVQQRGLPSLANESVSLSEDSERVLCLASSNSNELWVLCSLETNPCLLNNWRGANKGLRRSEIRMRLLWAGVDGGMAASSGGTVASFWQ
jgi:hypothetical protein